jgi:hypothetical protein
LPDAGSPRKPPELLDCWAALTSRSRTDHIRTRFEKRRMRNMLNGIARLNGNGFAALELPLGSNGAGWIELPVRVECQHEQEGRLPTCRPGRSYTTLRVHARPSEWTIAQLSAVIQSVRVLGQQQAAENLTCTVSRLTEDEQEARGARSVLELHGGEHRTTLFLPHLPLDSIMELLALGRDDDFCLVLTSLARQASAHGTQ